MHGSVLQFVARCLRPIEVRGQNVIELGAYDVNGSVRPLVLRYEPASYVGVDQFPGPGVDVVLDATALDEFMQHNLQPHSFGVVISTEMLEHAQNWQAAVEVMGALLQPGGTLILTARGPGFVHHNPPDYWRFTADDALLIARHLGLIVMEIEDDPQVPGFFLKAKKPNGLAFAVERAPAG
jgi:SAM-dependent methyltransferase